MLYFNGFCLRGEEELFKDIVDDHDYSVVGFSYGAIKAFEYTLKTDKRVDTLTLLSPAFFQNKSEKYIRTQLLHFKKDKERYIKNFMQNISYPCQEDLSKYLYPQTSSELKELLSYVWSKDKLETIISKNIQLNIHIGEKDKIVDTKDIYDFFKPYATIYYYKNKGHTLCKL